MKKGNISLVFLHGMGGDFRDWSFVREELQGFDDGFSSNYNCLNLEVRQSASLNSTLDDLLSQISSETDLRSQIVLCGYSMGGRLAILLAERLLENQRLVAAIFLASTGLGFSPTTEEERNLRLKTEERWLISWKANKSLFWKQWYQQELFQGYLDIPERRRNRWEENRLQLDFEQIRTQISVLSPAQHEHLLPKIEALLENKISLLYMVGEHDKKYCQIAKSLSTLPGMDVRIAPRSAHILPLEQPKWLAERLIELLETL